MDNTTDSSVLPVQTQTQLTVCLTGLIMRVTMPGERRGRKKKEGEARGVLRASREQEEFFSDFYFDKNTVD